MKKENLGKKIGYAVIALIILIIIVISVTKIGTNKTKSEEQNIQTENTTNVIDPEIIREENPDVTMEAGTDE